MVHVSTPLSSITANKACRSADSGVVRTLLMRSSPMRVSTVPISPVTRPEGAQGRVEQVCRRRLAVGAGDPQHGQRFAGAAVDQCRNLAEGGPRLWNHQHGHRDLVQREQGRSRRVGQHGNRTEADRCGNEAGTVHIGPRKGRIQVSGPDGARVQGHPGHDDASADDALGRRWNTGTLSHGLQADGAGGSGTRGRVHGFTTGATLPRGGGALETRGRRSRLPLPCPRRPAGPRS